MSGTREDEAVALEGLIGDLKEASPEQAVTLAVSLGMKPKKRLNANDRHRIASAAARRADRKDK